MDPRVTIALLLGACTQAPEPGTTPGTGPTGTFGEPVSTQQVLQGIQIGEGGDQLPCEPVLVRADDAVVEALFADLEGTWADQPYAYEGLTGTATLTVALDAAWELTWSDLESSTFDCASEPAVWVGALWLAIEGDAVDVQTPAFARTLEAPAVDFAAEVSSASLGLGQGTLYDLHGRLAGDALVVDVYADLLYGTPLGAFGE